MALAFRIDGYTQHPDGRVEVRYTAGVAPLSAAWQGLAFGYGSKQHVLDMIAEGTTEWLTPDLALRFVIAIWKTLQPVMNNPTVIVGKTLTFDPASLTATMRVA